MLTDRQRAILDKMEDGKSYTIYELETSMPTMSALQKQGLVKRHIKKNCNSSYTMLGTNALFSKRESA